MKKETDQPRKAARPEKNARAGSGRIWICVGLLFLLAALLLILYNVYDNHRAGQAAESVLEQVIGGIDEATDAEIDAEWDPEGTGEASGTDDVLDETLKEREMPHILIDGNAYIGYLQIPDLDLTLPVAEELTDELLRDSPCRYAGTVYRDDFVIAGHDYMTHFGNLPRLPIDTEVDFTDAEDKRYHYKILSIEVLDPDQVDEMIESSDDWDLTLFTCTISGNARYAIRCVRTEA